MMFTISYLSKNGHQIVPLILNFVGDIEFTLEDLVKVC